LHLGIKLNKDKNKPVLRKGVKIEKAHMKRRLSEIAERASPYKLLFIPGGIGSKGDCKSAIDLKRCGIKSS
jgi:hypothetical protein